MTLENWIKWATNLLKCLSDLMLQADPASRKCQRHTRRSALRSQLALGIDTS